MYIQTFEYQNKTATRTFLYALHKCVLKFCAFKAIFQHHAFVNRGATTLFNAQIPEKLIQQRTGHRSIEALCQYKRTSDCQQLRRCVNGHVT